MQLIAKTNSAIAVGDSLTTLVDWINVENSGQLTIIVENFGGGNGDNITDVQIDTSDDGGVTVLTDQFAAVLTVPISLGAGHAANFTTTAKYIRVRAVCATDDDTTANVWLMAELGNGRICTLADIKDRLGIAKSDNDAVIKRIIINIESVFDSFTGRNLIQPASDIIEYYTGGSAYITLKRYPIISITTVKEAVDYDYVNADALIADCDYRLIAQRGCLYRIYDKWSELPDCVQVVYRGGYVPAGQTIGTGETQLPDDIREAAIEQGSFIFKRRDDIGLSGVGFSGGSYNIFSAMDLLPQVKNILNKYVRRAL